MPVRRVLVAGLLIAGGLAFYGQGCGKPSFTPHDAQSSGNPSGTPAVRTCPTPNGVSGSPKTIEDAIALINALPKPVSVSCFVESLDRPLQLYATRSTSSAQPANGTRSPRVFIFLEPLLISVVPDGPGKDVVEFSVVQAGNQRSLKGELGFPVTATLPATAAYDRIRTASGTGCRVCHSAENASTLTAGAFTSGAIRPDPLTRVDLNYLNNENTLCNAVSEPGRCAVLKALFSFGAPVNRDFPGDMPRF